MRITTIPGRSKETLKRSIQKLQDTCEDLKKKGAADVIVYSAPREELDWYEIGWDLVTVYNLCA